MNFKFLNLYAFILCQFYFSNIGSFVYENSYFFGVRYYDSKKGRFIQADPVTPSPKSEGLNRYAYVYNNPVKLIDPSGNTPVSSNENSAPQSRDLPNYTPFESWLIQNSASMKMDLGKLTQLTLIGVDKAVKAQAARDLTTAWGSMPDRIILNDIFGFEPDFPVNHPSTPDSLKHGSYAKTATRLRDFGANPRIAGSGGNFGVRVDAHNIIHFPEARGAQNPAVLGRLISKSEAAGTFMGPKQIGAAAAYSNTPMVVAAGHSSREIELALRGAQAATLASGLFNFVGGSAAVFGYSYEPNLTLRTLGQTSGGLQMLGGAAQAAGSYATTASRGATLMSWGSKAMRIGVGGTAVTLYFDFLFDMLENPPDYGQGLDGTERRMQALGGGLSNSYFKEKQEAYRKENKIRDSHPFDGSVK